MKSKLIPVYVALLNCLNSLLVSWIRVNKSLTCPQCSGQDFSSWGSYQRRWYVPYFDYEYRWRVKRFRCRACQRTFSRYTNTRWAHTKQPPSLSGISFLFRLIPQTPRKRHQTRSRRGKTDSGINGGPTGGEAETQARYLGALQFLLSDCLNEVQRRLVGGLIALQLGKEGITRLQEWTGMTSKTIRRGMRELLDQCPTVHWGKPLRRPGGGRKRVDTESKVVQGLEELLKEETAGEPMKGLKWTRKTLRKLSQALADQGLQAAPNTVRRLLKAQGYSLKVNAKRKAFKANHPLRNDQFEYIKTLKADCIKQGIPVISVDAKKIEYLGQFSNAGKTWCQEPYKTWDHDFLDRAVGKLVPYGIYDLFRDQGYIYAGTNASTSELAVDGLVFWWTHYGRHQYPQAKKLVILSDCGGADSCRSQLWKWDLQEKLVDAFGITVEVCHYPPGTSKWNPIEHRLFSFISLNWAGRPLTSYEVALNYIRRTTTQTGLRVEAFLTEKRYSTGRQIPPELLETLQLTNPAQAPNFEWTYRLSPRDATTLRLRHQIQDSLKVDASLKPKGHPGAMVSQSQENTPQKRPKAPPVPIYYSITKAARLLDVCAKTIRRWEADDKIKCHRTSGNHRRITEAEIQRIKRLRESGTW